MGRTSSAHSFIASVYHAEEKLGRENAWANLVLFLPFTPPDLQSELTEYTAVCMLRAFPVKLSPQENAVQRAVVGVGHGPAILLYSALMTKLHLSPSVPVNAKPRGPEVTLVSFARDSFHSQLRTNTSYPFSIGPNVISSKTLPQWVTLILNF